MSAARVPSGNRVYRISFPRSWLWVGVAATALVFAACDQSVTAERKPGNRDYPSENPQPVHLLDLRIEIPPSLRGRLRAEYAATEDVASCQQIAGLDDDAPFYLSIPLHLTRRGESYRQILAVDRFQPGRCGWDFARIKYSATAQGPARDDLLMYTRGTLYTGHDEPKDVRLDVWCMSIPGDSGNQAKVCNSLDMLRYSFPDSINRDFMDSVPSDQHHDGPPGYIGSDATSVTVRFHDLDLMLREHRPDASTPN